MAIGDPAIGEGYTTEDENSFGRINYIVTQVQENVGDRGMKLIDRTRLLYRGFRTEQKVAKESQPYQLQETLTTVADQETYVMGHAVQKIRTLIEPTDWASEIIMVEDQLEWKRIKRDTSIADQTQPLFAFSWGRTLSLVPAPSDAQNLIVLYYGMPTTPWVKGADPELDQVWDDAIIYLMTAEIMKKIGDSDGFATFMGDYEREKHHNSMEAIRPISGAMIKVRHSSDDIGY